MYLPCLVSMCSVIISVSLLTTIYSARWGRCQEAYGEDPYLQAELATQYVQGLQYGPDTKHIEAIVSFRQIDHKWHSFMLEYMLMYIHMCAVHANDFLRPRASTLMFTLAQRTFP